MKNRRIKKVAVLGSGVMGSQIALHFANIGCEVLLLDIAPRELNEDEKAKGLSLEDPVVKNRIVRESFNRALKAKPAPAYTKSVAQRVTLGNFTDDYPRLSEMDWVLEAVVENLDIKKQVFAEVEKNRRPGTLVTTNTSGIPVNLMVEGRSEDFQKHFCGTHFFNPPRYLRLLEIVPAKTTDPDVVDFLMRYGDVYLGKQTVLCKDTPAFIANRVGVFSIMAIFHLMRELDLSIEEVDALTGPVSGRPKSATFRTSDLVGIDTLVKVAANTAAACPDDEARELFAIPGFLKTMVEKKWLGDKTGQGFYKKTRDKQGKKQILALDLKTMEYRPKQKPSFETLAAAKPVDNLRERLQVLYRGKDKAGEFYRRLMFLVLAYVSHRIPEIADELYKVDDAMKAGFGWETGPFETWDTLGVEKVLADMKSAGHEPAPWVEEMLAAGHTSFYRTREGRRYYFDLRDKDYREVPGTAELIILDNYRSEKPVWQNAGTTLHDIGDGVLCLEFHTKMNSMGSEVIEGINQAISIAEKDFAGLVIGNDAANFSVGANLAMILMLAVEQEYDELDMVVRLFQQTIMRTRYSAVPVVVAPHGMTLGGGCELTLHADKVQAAAETYIGLVEVGVGLIPAGGGTKEMTLRASDEYREGEVELPVLQKRFLTIAQAQVATSGHEAYEKGILRKGLDEVVINQARVIAEAKQSVLDMAEAGYTQPSPREDVKVLGRMALAALLTGVDAFERAHYISEHDKKIATKLAWVMSGGDLTAPQLVSEQYLLDLEREAFISLLGEKKTLERIEHMLKTGKALRN